MLTSKLVIEMDVVLALIVNTFPLAVKSARKRENSEIWSGHEGYSSRRQRCVHYLTKTISHRDLYPQILS